MRPRLPVRSPSNSFANTEKPSTPECGARNRPERRQPSWPTKQQRAIFNGWMSSTSRAGTKRTGRAYSPATTPNDVLVELHGQASTHGIREHIEAMKAFVKSTGGVPVQVKAHS